MPHAELRLLALDGGGVRGLSALMILEQLMEKVSPDAPPKPCDYFDMIGGTSTGGLIAIMLGRLRMSVADSIDAYLSLSDRVFHRTKLRVTVQGKSQGQFDSEELARAIKEVIKGQGLQEDALLKDAPNAGCKVFVCATSRETSETVCLTTYRTPRGNSDLLNSVEIWEACRATSAASSFFDPIAVGRFGEEFVDGATGANNPVREVWDQAQLVWGPEPLEGKVKCLVSIGTGVPSLKPFKDDALHIGETLVAIATETEQTAERFRRERSLLDSTGRYYRFNVLRGLEDIGLEEAKKVKEIAAATRRYIGTHDVSVRMQECAGSVAGREYFGEYRTPFSLAGVPIVKQFVDRPVEMIRLEEALLPQQEQSHRQKIYVLYGLGGIGKTQLAVEFARRHHRRFSSVFWLDGRSEDSVKRSIASCASRIPQGQIAEASRDYTADSSIDVDVVVEEVMRWLAQPDNTAWLLIIDNVDREYSAQGTDRGAYDVRRYLSGADHGSILITTRLARLEQLGESQQVRKVSGSQAQAIFKNWYRKKHDIDESEHLLEMLDGLPLAIAQAGAYLQESGVELSTYLRFYEQQWDELMDLGHSDDSPLQDYPDRSVWTTWAISYKAIHNRHEATANLLILWSFLDNKDLWHGLFAAACQASLEVERMLSNWVGDIATNELKFSRAMQLLRSYSLIEGVEGLKGYATHPVVHRWAYHYRGKGSSSEIGRLAVATIGWAALCESTGDYSIVQRRLLPHAQACSLWVEQSLITRDPRSDGTYGGDPNGNKEAQVLLGGIDLLGSLYTDQDKLAEAEQMYKRALQGYEEALGPKHASTLNTVNNLGILYKNQGKLVEAEQMFERALRGYEEALGLEHISTLQTVNNLGILYTDQGKLAEAERMYKRALRGYEEALGPNNISTLDTVNNLGNLYKIKGKLVEAEQMFERALRGYEETLGPKHTSTLGAVNNLGNLYADQGKLAEAEQIYEWALRGYEEVLGPKHTSTLGTVGNLGLLYKNQGKLAEAKPMFERVLREREETLGPKHISTLDTVNNLGNLYTNQGNLAEAEQMFERALRGYEEALGPKHTSTLDTVNNLGILYTNQGKLAEAEQMFERALQGYEEALGPKHTSTLDTVNNLGNAYKNQDKLVEAEQMFERALRGYEETLGPKHRSTLDTVDNLGNLYADYGKLAEAEQMYKRALQRKEEALGLEHKSTLDTIDSLGNLYADYGNQAEAERMYKRAVRGKEEALGPKHTSTLDTVNSLGILYTDQGKLAEAEQMFERALRGYEETLGPKHRSTLGAVNNLGNIYKNQGKPAEAEQMYKRALQGKEEVLGLEHKSTLDTMDNLGNLYADYGKQAEAERIYKRALRGKEEALGPKHASTLDTVNNLGNIYKSQGKLAEAEQMFERALRGYEETLGSGHGGRADI